MCGGTRADENEVVRGDWMVGEAAGGDVCGGTRADENEVDRQSRHGRVGRVAIVLLLRHGRTTANNAGRLAGRGAADLDPVGEEQARAVGERLADVPLALVATSPLARCVRTVELALPGRPATVEPDLIECGYGEWEGRSLATLAKDPLWPMVQQHPAGVVFPGGEAMAEMAARAVRAVRRLDAAAAESVGADAVWLACSHGDVIKAVVADALGLHLDLFQRIVVDPGSITVIRYTHGRPFVVRLNDTGGDLAALLVPPRPARGRRGAARAADSDAPVGGGAGPTPPPTGRPRRSRPAAATGRETDARPVAASGSASTGSAS